MKVCSVRFRILMMSFLVLCFSTQTYLIYSDDTGYALPELSEKAIRGNMVWREQNCQSCHQVFGFGGFLGPDLTNRGHIFPPLALQAILKAGPGQMPSFNLSMDEVESLNAYFVELNNMGNSQPRVSRETNEAFLSIGKLPWFAYKGKK